MNNEIEKPDPSLTPEQEAIVATLSESFIQKVDLALLANAKKSWRKVATLVGTTMMDREIPGLPDLFYSQRVRKLVEAGQLEAEGNLTCVLVKSDCQASNHET